MKPHAPRLIVLGHALVLAGVVATAAGQDTPPEKTLEGPRVPEGLVQTLVSYDAAGRLRRLEGRPEDSAVGLAVKDPARRDKAREASINRVLALGVHLINHMDTARALAEARRTGDNKQADKLARELYDSFDPGHERDPLIAPLKGILDPSELAEVQRLCDEYWRAWIDREIRGAKDQSPDARRKIQDRLAYSLFQDDLRVAFENAIKPYQDKLDALERRLDPTPEQKQAIRDAVIAFVREARLKPTPEQRRALMRQIYHSLDEKRREEFFEIMVEQL